MPTSEPLKKAVQPDKTMYAEINTRFSMEQWLASSGSIIESSHPLLKST